MKTLKESFSVRWSQWPLLVSGPAVSAFVGLGQLSDKPFAHMRQMTDPSTKLSFQWKDIQLSRCFHVKPYASLWGGGGLEQNMMSQCWDRESVCPDMWELDLTCENLASQVQHRRLLSSGFQQRENNVVTNEVTSEYLQSVLLFSLFLKFFF